MSRPVKIALAGLLLVVLTWLGLYVLQRLHPYEEVVDRGPSPEAQRNDYLAAELFLRQQQLPVKRANSLEILQTLSSVGQTLLLLAPRHNMTPRQSQLALDWAAKGGHLVFVAEALWDQKKDRSGDLLLDKLDIQQHLSKENDEKTDSPDTAISPALQEKEEERYPELTKVYLENEEAPAYVKFDTSYHLLDNSNRAYAWANSGKATHMLQLEHGDGLITVLTDAWIWKNDNIADYDNAWLLWYLTQDSTVTLLYDSQRDNLLDQLLKHYPAALIALVLLLILLQWHVGMRHGPLQPPPVPARRQLEEHLRATADFLLRRTSQQHLLSNLQRDIQRRARYRHPGFERLPIAEQWQVLGRLTHLPSSTVSQIMRPIATQKLSAADFTRQVANLQSLRNAL